LKRIELKAGNESRTRVIGLENRHNNHYTIPAFVKI
jgi:hypothetical protein